MNMGEETNFFLQKNSIKNIELPYDPEIPLLVIYPMKTIIQKDTCTPVFIAALFTTAKNTEAT